MQARTLDGLQTHTGRLVYGARHICARAAPVVSSGRPMSNANVSYRNDEFYTGAGCRDRAPHKPRDASSRLNRHGGRGPAVQRAQTLVAPGPNKRKWTG